MFGTASGVVTEFDAHRGLGWVETHDGSRFAFHCTEIADGTREIAVGATVRFEIVAGVLGRREAAAITTQA
jgi:CspA family cold shock protein